MKLLIAEDDPLYRVLYSRLLASEYEIVMASDGIEALHILEADRGVRLAVIDWLMPRMTGAELCRQVRAIPGMESLYLLIATAKQELGDIVEGFVAGASDYIRKPFCSEELIARLRVGRRVGELQQALELRVAQLQEALDNVTMLQGLLPICSYCKRIRDDHNYWEQIDTYVSNHSQAIFSHGVCPECYAKFLQPELKNSVG